MKKIPTKKSGAGFFYGSDTGRVPLSELHKDIGGGPVLARRGLDYWWFALIRSYELEESRPPPELEEPPPGMPPAHRAAISRGMRRSSHVRDAQRRRRARERTP